MKKLFVVALSFALLFDLVGCAENVEDVNQTEDFSTEATTVIAMESTSQEESSATASNFTITEIEKYDFAAKPEQFALVNMNPCVLVDGVAYLYEDGDWNEIQSDKKISQIYSGDIFCGLTEDGKACFSAYDKELETEITSCLDGMNKKAISVTCDYSRIAIMFEDYSICVIDF